MSEKREPYTMREKDIENARLGYWDEDDYPDDDDYEYAERYGYGYHKRKSRTVPFIDEYDFERDDLEEGDL